MKKIITEFGDILLGVAIFILLVVGAKGVSFKGEATRIATDGLSEISTKVVK